MSCSIDKYVTFYLFSIQFRLKLIELTRITINCRRINSNLCQTVDTIISNNDSLFFKIFSTYNVMANETGLFVNVLMNYDLHMILLCSETQFIIEMDVNSSLLLVLNVIYEVVSMIIIIISNTASEIIGGIFSRLVCTFSKTKTKENNTNNNNKHVTMIQYNTFWQLNIYFKCFEVNLMQMRANCYSTSKKLRDISSINNDNRNRYFFEISKFTKIFFCFWFWIATLLMLCMIGCVVIQLLLQLIHKLNQLYSAILFNIVSV